MFAQTYQSGAQAPQQVQSKRVTALILAEQRFGSRVVSQVCQREQAGWKFICYHVGTYQTIGVTPPNSQREYLWCDILVPSDDQQAFCQLWGATIDSETITILEAAEMIASYNDQGQMSF